MDAALQARVRCGSIVHRPSVDGAAEDCPSCGGKVFVDCRDCRGEGNRTCMSCDGEGEGRASCRDCGGRGWREPEHTITDLSMCPLCKGAGSREAHAHSEGFEAQDAKKCTSCLGDGKLRCEVCLGKRKTSCATCYGHGVLRTLVHGKPKPCERCGNGRRKGKGVMDCNACRKTGARACPTCDGEGRRTAGCLGCRSGRFSCTGCRPRPATLQAAFAESVLGVDPDLVEADYLDAVRGWVDAAETAAARGDHERAIAWYLAAVDALPRNVELALGLEAERERKKEDPRWGSYQEAHLRALTESARDLTRGGTRALARRIRAVREAAEAPERSEGGLGQRSSAGGTRSADG